MNAHPDIAVKVSRIYKDFVLPHDRQNSIREKIFNFHKPSFEYQHALKDIDFEVKRGEFLGIVGRNGSGKSTLLKIIGGIYQPTKGNVQVSGTLTPFIELGIGFNPELSGRDNVFLNGAILGLSRKEVMQKYDEIVSFAELEKFMDQKLKNYSSGMQVRLAFSIAIQAHNDILLIDEVLAVGDAAFQRKCFETFKEIKRSEKTVIFVSHGMDAIREYCDRAILIENGHIISEGSPDNVANDYTQLFNADAISGSSSHTKRWGDFKAEIENININITDKKIGISYEVVANEDISPPIVGLIIKNLDGQHIIDSNNKWKKLKSIPLASGNRLEVAWELPNVFKDGKYVITVAASHEDGFGFYDWQEEVKSFNIRRDEVTAGMILTDHIMTIRKKA